MTTPRKWLYLVMWSVDGKDGLYYEWSLLDTAGWAELSAQMHRMWQAGDIVDYIIHHFEPSTHQPVNSRGVLSTVHSTLSANRPRQKRLKKASIHDKSVEEKPAVTIVEPEIVEPEIVEFESDEPEKPASSVPDNPDYF